MIKLNLSPFFDIGFSEKKEGNVDFKFGPKKEVQKNIKLLTNKLNFSPQETVQAEQIHQCRVAWVGKQDLGKRVKNADALITNDVHVALMIRIADCVPILLFDPQKKAIGLAHSGWRGTVGKIILETITKMMQEFSSKPQNLHLHLGPCLQKCCNSSKEVPIQAQLPEWDDFIRKDSNTWFINLSGFILKNALQVGLLEKNITTSKICTMTAKNLFSHKRSNLSLELEGRFAAIIRIR